MVTEPFQGPAAFLSDTLFAFVAYDSLYQMDVMFYGRTNNTSSVEIKPNIPIRKSVFLSTPVPNPAQNVVRFKLYWDIDLPIENVKFRAYNILGELVSKAMNFKLENENSYSGGVVWEFNKLPKGIYLVVVQIENYTSAKTVCIE